MIPGVEYIRHIPYIYCHDPSYDKFYSSVIKNTTIIYNDNYFSDNAPISNEYSTDLLNMFGIGMDRYNIYTHMDRLAKYGE